MTAGKKHSCPGETAACAKVCYAARGFYLMPSVKKRNKTNFLASKSDSFILNMLRQIQFYRVRVMRVHASGDFYDAQYIRKWIAIVKRTPKVQYYAYTRSWQLPELECELAALAQLPNFQLWLSTDMIAHTAPFIPGTRIAYLALNQFDTPASNCDLVFRNYQTPSQVYVQGVRVCPVENGTVGGQNLTCSTCGLCWEQDKLTKLDYRKNGEDQTTDGNRASAGRQIHSYRLLRLFHTQVPGRVFQPTAGVGY
jgi:Gene product 88